MICRVKAGTKIGTRYSSYSNILKRSHQLMNRHEAREKAFQILFQIDMNDIDPQSAMKSYLGTVEADSFLNTLIQGVVKNKTSIDETKMNHMENWSIHRIALVEKTIMRIATYEI